MFEQPVTHSYHVTAAEPADCREALQLPLDTLKGIGPVRAAQLAGRGLATVEDLLYHLPFRYEDRRDVAAVSSAVPGESRAFVGRLTSIRSGRVRRGHRILTGTLTDDTGSLDLVWFNAVRHVSDALRAGQRLAVYGRVAPGRGRAAQRTPPGVRGPRRGRGAAARGAAGIRKTRRRLAGQPARLGGSSPGAVRRVPAQLPAAGGGGAAGAHGT